MSRNEERNHHEMDIERPAAEERQEADAESCPVDIAIDWEAWDREERREREAAKRYEEAAGRGDAEAQFQYGLCCLCGAGVRQNSAKGAKWLLKAARQGHAPAEYHLGTCYLYGRGVEENTEEAVRWIKKSAEQRFAQAQS